MEFEFSMNEESLDESGDEGLLSGVTNESFVKTEEDDSAPRVDMQAPRQASENAYYTAVLKHGLDGGPEQLVTEFMQVKNDLMTTGTSESSSDLMRLLSEDRQKGNAKAIENILADPDESTEFKKLVVKDYLAGLHNRVDLRTEYEEKLFEMRPEETEEEAREKDMDLSYYNERLVAQEQILVAANKAIAQGDVGIWRSLEGFLEFMVPFLEGVTVEQARDAAFGDNEDTLKTVFRTIFSGQGIAQFRKKLERLPPQQRIEATKRALEVISNLPGADMKKMYLIKDLIEDPDYAMWQQALSNLVGVLDSTFILSPLGKALKAVGRLPRLSEGTPRIHPSTPLGTARLANPAVAVEMEAMALLDDTGEFAKAFGVTKEDVVSNDLLFKNITDDIVADGDPSLAATIDEINQTRLYIDEATSTQGLNVTADAKEAARQEVQLQLQAVEGGPVMHVKNSVAHSDGERYYGMAVYGKNEEKGYNNLLAMHKDIKRMVGSGIPRESLVVMVKDPATAMLAIKDKAPGIKGSEFFIGRKFDHVYSREDAAIFGADAVSAWPLARTVAGGYVYDIASRFDGQIANAFLRAKDNGAAIQKQLLEHIQKGMMGTNSFFQMGNKSKLKVFSVLRQGSEQTKTFTPGELSAPPFNLSVGEQKAYYAFRKVSDVLWELTNRTHYRKLKSENLKEIRVADTDVSWFGKPIKTPQGVSTKHAYDSGTGAVRRLTDKEITELYESGGYIAEVKGFISAADGHKATQVIVDNVKTTLNELPLNPLPYIDGYYQRTYKENYFVRRIPKVAMVNGEPITGKTINRKRFGEVMSAYPSKRDAVAAKQQYEAEFPDYDFIWDRAKELDLDPAVQDYQIYERSLRTTRKRGSHVAGNADNGLATVEDPVEALMRTVRGVSNHVAMTDVTESMKNSWKLSYGHMAEKGQFPTKVTDIKKGFGTAEEYGSAVAIKQLIDTVSNTPSYTEQAWRTFMVSFGEWLEGVPGMAKLGDVAREVGKSSPIAGIRKLPSHLYIALRPLRQLLVQSGQLMQYVALEPKWMASGQAAREISALMMVAGTKGGRFTKGGMDAAARVYGGPRAEFDQVVETFFTKSGLPDAVDANWLIENVVNNVHEETLKSPLRRGVEGVTTRPYNKIVGIGKKLGFDPGELINLAGSWLIAKRRWLRENPELASKWSQKQYADVIAADARKISYAMTQPGTFAYQQGALSIPLQFLAVPHKALLSMTANKYWSKADKGKLLAANLGLFGAYGVGLASTFDAIQEKLGYDFSEDELQFFKGGIVDIMFNKLLALAFDESGEDPTKILFSASFSPIADGVFPAHSVFEALMDGDWAKMILGPSLGLLDLQKGRLANALQDMNIVFNQADLSKTEKMHEFLTIGASVASGYNDFIKARFMFRHSQIASKNGQLLGIVPTHAEIGATLFGFQLQEVDNMYAQLSDIADIDKARTDAFDQYYDSMVRIYSVYGDTDPEMARKLARREANILNVFDKDEIPLLLDHIRKKDRQMGKTTNDSLLKKMIRWSSFSKEARVSIRNRIMGMAMDEKQKQEFLRILKDDGVMD